MKYLLLLIIPILLLIFACKKDKMTPCSVVNKGIYISDQPNPYGAGNKINTFHIDSVILSSKIFKLWFTEDGSGEQFLATLRKQDNTDFKSGKHYFIEPSSLPSGSTSEYPMVFFDIISTTSSAKIFYLYDKYEVCIDVEDNLFGILIDGIKVADSRSGRSDGFLTLSLENNEIKFR